MNRKLLLEGKLKLNTNYTVEEIDRASEEYVEHPFTSEDLLSTSNLPPVLKIESKSYNIKATFACNSRRVFFKRINTENIENTAVFSLQFKNLHTLSAFLNNSKYIEEAFEKEQLRVDEFYEREEKRMEWEEDQRSPQAQARRDYNDFYDSYDPYSP